MLKQWLDQRALLNHDVLCNQLRNELASLRSEPTQSHTPRLSMWPKRKKEYITFLDNAINALSFSSLLDRSIFDCWSNSMKENWRPVFHGLFLNTTNIPNKIIHLKELLNDSAETVLSFSNVRPRERTLKMVVALQEKLDALSTAISSLPHNVGDVL